MVPYIGADALHYSASRSALQCFPHANWSILTSVLPVRLSDDFVRTGPVCILECTTELLAHAEVGEDVVEGFLRRDLAASNLAKDFQYLSQVFGKEVARETDT